MNFQLLLLAAVIGITVAGECGCPPGSDSSKCDCCPPPCCCRCTGDVKSTQKPPKKACRQLLDLALVIDSSGSIARSDWAAGKTFMKDIVSLLNNVGDAQHVASIYYSSNATLAWNLDSPQTDNIGALDDAIDELPLVAKFTNTVEALELAVDEVFNGQGGDSPDRANILLLITDGRSNFRLSEKEAVAAKIQAVSSVVVIGVTTQVNQTELELFASSPENVFTVQDFKALEDKLLNQIAFTVCPTDMPKPEEDCFCCCPPPRNFPAYYY